MFAGEGRKRSQLAIATSGEYVLGGSDIALPGLVGHVKLPSGNFEPIMLKKKPSGKLGKALVYSTLCYEILSDWENYEIFSG